MREQLLGYLLGALEPTEHEMVEARLAEDPALQEDLMRLESKVAPLAADEDHEDYEPPVGLAARTCNFVSARTGQPARAAAAAELAPAGTWRLQDLLVAGGICIAASLLVFPAISHSQFKARLTACQNNLREVGTALTYYSQAHDGFFPVVPQHGNLAVAGAYAPMLREAGLLNGSANLICPESALAQQMAQQRDFSLPTLEEIKTASREQLPKLHSRLGGSYGYSLGYSLNGGYHGHRNRGRSNFALMADAPDEETTGRSANHGCCGQNVLFEDMHVGFLKSCRLAECDDHIYVNTHGIVGAGIGPDDAVIGRSSAPPVIFSEN